jgi:predicted MPP superfamily phosphohydrolase
VAVAIEGLPPELEGFRIVQITDLHISPAIRRNWVHDLVVRVNGLNPDVIAFTGDIADDAPAEIREDTAPLAGLSARSGKFFVTGNHEYMYGAEAWMREMTDLGFTVLHNDHRLVARGRASVLVGGVADLRASLYSAHTSSPAAAFGDGAGADMKILLAHHPESVAEAAEAGFDLQLSGHTHGGLIRPFAWLSSLIQPYQSGLYRHRGTQLYVSNGAGYWGVPIRLGVPSEIALLTLTRAK